jgi:sec-independent protein translocase protein TatC
MLLMLVPLYGLYEFAILAIRLTHWRAARSKKAAQKNPTSVEMEGPGRNLGPKSPPGGGGVGGSGPM